MEQGPADKGRVQVEVWAEVAAVEVEWVEIALERDLQAIACVPAAERK